MAEVEVDRFITELRTNGELLARAAEYAGPDAAVPSCPGWTVTAAVGHLAKVHRWASWQVRGGAPDRFTYQRPEPAELLPFFRAGVAELAAELAKATDSQPMHTLWPARSPRLFWARRQAHETAIHRVDLQLTAGYGVSDFEPDFAADGVDELLMGMAAGQFSRAGIRTPCTIGLTPLDANLSWTVQVTPAELTVRRGAEDTPDLSVFGLASDLYRWAWNRAEDTEVSLRGDLTLADRWHADFTVGARPAS